MITNSKINYLQIILKSQIYIIEDLKITEIETDNFINSN